MQKVVQPLADQIPPSSPPNITSYITTKQLSNTAPIAKGSTMQLPIRVTSSNLMDYDLGKEEALSIQLQLSPKLPLFDFNKEDN